MAANISPPFMRLRRGYWRPMIDEIVAMKLHDLLIWDVPRDKLRTINSRLAELRSEEFNIISRWYGGKVFIVRVL